MIRNKVNNNKFDYEEEVREFTGLIFHCPECDKVFHLHIAEIFLTQKTTNEGAKGKGNPR
jgi:hypothetical protein